MMSKIALSKMTRSKREKEPTSGRPGNSPPAVHAGPAEANPNRAQESPQRGIGILRQAAEEQREQKREL